MTAHPGRFTTPFEIPAITERCIVRTLRMSALTSVMEVTVFMEAAAQGVEERVLMATFVM
ncbi:hypothetical protein GWA01_16640 [Gluconobacter wancherniae NBRC 103581]|uniref:Uncharacterized protein n=1 Tax=Gluconobacter wancherniae NBRC 103581 TaxID=656744 RepID=A0A511B0C3_9PROT|nr:hypothetical protein AA103581_1920 [Gluconobacter wancherniae NBRC 103581]GEK93894.1 hypothetical protein GWA01_16640 [Gluconobacter wancherniae NBRC 103581]